MKKLTAVILAALILAGSFGLTAFAARQTRYLVLGDSIAYGSGISNSKEAVYGKIVADTNGYEYENYAVPGHTTGNLLSRMENETVKEAIGKADIINISIGGNNFLLGNINSLLYDGIVAEDYPRFDELAENFYKDLEKIVSVIRSSNKSALIIIQTIYNPQTGYVGQVYQQGADRLNAKMFEFAKANPGQIAIADVAKALTDAGDFASDMIHPSAAGNEKIAETILQTLAENGYSRGSEKLVIKEQGKDIQGTGAFSLFVNLYGRIFHLLAVIRNLFSFGR